MAYQTLDLCQADDWIMLSWYGFTGFYLILSEVGHTFIYLRGIYSPFPVSYHLLLGYWTFFSFIFIGTLYVIKIIKSVFIGLATFWSLSLGNKTKQNSLYGGFYLSEKFHLYVIVLTFIFLGHLDFVSLLEGSLPLKKKTNKPTVSANTYFQDLSLSLPSFLPSYLSIHPFPNSLGRFSF